MSWQNYHETIMTAIDNSGITSIATSLGSALGGVTSASGTDRLGLVTAAFAALNGATTITSVISGKYGDYEKEGHLAKLYYTLDAYTAISVALTTFLLVGGMDWLSSFAYGSLPVTLFAFDYLRKAHLRSHPEKLRYYLLLARMIPVVLLYGSMLAGRDELARRTLQVVASLGVIKSLSSIFFPERRLLSHKYDWDSSSEKWVHVHDLEHKGELPMGRLPFFIRGYILSYVPNKALYFSITTRRSDRYCHNRRQSYPPGLERISSSFGIWYGHHESHWIIRYRSCCLSPP